MNKTTLEDLIKAIDVDELAADQKTIEQIKAIISKERAKLLDRVYKEVIGKDEKSKHVRQFQCPSYGIDCFEWQEQYKMNQESPYCSVHGKKMKSVEFDEQDGDDWTRNELRVEQRTTLKSIIESYR